ncbi:hypothetical protein JCM3770_002333 [Rhodotorula araucariae]
MAPAFPPPGQPEVFQASLAVERPYVRDVVRALLATICFHRAWCGNLRPESFSVASVTFSTSAEPELEELIAAKVELVARALLDGPSAADGAARRTKLYVSLYPTPLPSLPAASRARPHPGTPSSVSRSASPATGDARTAPSPTRRHHAVALAHAAPAAVSSALGWFSASARAALIGGEAPVEAPQEAGGATGQEEETRVLEVLKERGVRPWEGWCVEFELVGEAAGRARAPVAGEERLRAQLNDFLLRALEWSMLKTAHVPPITTTDRMPYGVLILVDPPLPPFAVPKPVVTEVREFPALHKALVTGRAGHGVREGNRRAASAGGARW